MQDCVIRARALIGVRFRPQGRSVSEGLDCIGVAAIAFGFDERSIPADYALRGGSQAQAERRIAQHLVPVSAVEARPGDLLLVEAGPAQLHAIVLSPAGYIHADAGLRRVVEVPGAVPWPVLSAWRHPQSKR